MSQIEEDLAFISAVIATSGIPKCIGPWGRICDYINETQKSAHNKQSTTLHFVEGIGLVEE